MPYEIPEISSNKKQLKIYLPVDQYIIYWHQFYHYKGLTYKLKTLMNVDEIRA